MTPFRHLLSLFILSFFLYGGSVSATSVIPISLSQLTEKADTIVTGIVIETHAYWNEGRIYTDTAIETMEFFKHPTPDQPPVIPITSLGGQIGERRMVVHGVPRMIPGEEVLLFLMKQGETYTIYGLHYGLCRIYIDPESASQRITGPLFYARTTQSLSTQSLRLNPLPPHGERLEIFFQRIRNLTSPPVATDEKEGPRP